MFVRVMGVNPRSLAFCIICAAPAFPVAEYSFPSSKVAAWLCV